MTLLLVLRFAYVELLAAVTILVAPTAYRAMTRHTQGRDFLFLLLWGMAVNRLWFLIHGISFNDPPAPGFDAAFIVSCYVFAIALEALALVAFRWETQNAS